jgi:hypothetical protein
VRKGKLSADDRARARLLEHWQHRPEYGDPIGCVATTYTFDAAFFEDHCLARFVSMDTDPNEDARAYAIEREEKLSQVFSGVLVDQAHVPMHRSLRWHVFPVRVENDGILHAKLSLLAWNHCIRVIIGSANLSEAGYRKNLEVAGTLDFTADGSIPLSLLREVLDFIESTRQNAPGADQLDGSQAGLSRFINRVREHVSGWAEGGWKRGEPEVALAITGPDRPSLFDQLRQLWRFSPASEAWVVSPFFDEGNRAIVTAQALESLLIQREHDIHFFISGRQLPDGTTELDMPSSLRASKRSKTTYHHHRVVPHDGEEQRSLHAKSIWMERDGQGLYCLGSSNFTQPGTGTAPSGAPRHIELNLVYVLPDTAGEFARVCNRTYPNVKEVDVENDHVSFLQLADRTPETGALRGLPAAFGTATVFGSDGGLRLELELQDEAPSQFVVSLPTEEVVLRSDQWSAAGGRLKHTYELGPITPPSFLTVVWSSLPDIQAYRSCWPVNVSDPALLPHPEDLRSLKLEDLITVLTSARPAHETIARLLKTREASRKKPDEIETDPHKKIDTAHHLLKRMRRAAEAMEELRARLERPTFSREALRARLLGPLGPLALASRLVAEEPAGAAFMIAELATTIAHAKLDPRGDLPALLAAEEVQHVVEHLKRMASEHPAPANLRNYVETVFQQVCP